MKRPEDEKEKFASIFERINVSLMNRRRDTSKTYFKKISGKMILLLFFSTLLIVVSFFDMQQVNRNNFDIYYLLFGMISSLLVVIFSNRNKNVFKLIHISFPMMIIGYVLNYVSLSIDNNILTKIALVFVGAGYGVVIGFAIIIFIYLLNMSERLIAILLLIFFTFNFSFFDALSLPLYVRYLIVPVGIILIAYMSMLIMYREQKLELESFSAEILPKSTVVVMLFVVIYVCLNLGVMGAIEVNWSGIRGTATRFFYSTNYYVGFIIAFIVTIVNFLFNRKALVTSLIIFAITAVFSYQNAIVTQLFINAKIWKPLAECSFGFATAMGIITTSLLVGNLLEQRLSRNAFMYIIFSICCFIFGSIFLVEGLWRIKVSILATSMVFFTSFIAIIIFLAALYGSFERKENKDTPVANMKKNQNKYKVINPDEVLSDKEKAIFVLLLEGFTLRQISAELGMKYDTVNFHYKNIYRKLEVNSKVELFIRYGQN